MTACPDAQSSKIRTILPKTVSNDADAVSQSTFYRYVAARRRWLSSLAAPVNSRNSVSVTSPENKLRIHLIALLMEKSVPDVDKPKIDNLAVLSSFMQSSTAVTRRKIAVVTANLLGFSPTVISDVLGVSQQLCLRYISLYQQGGIEKLQINEVKKRNLTVVRSYEDATVDLSTLVAGSITNTSLVRFAIISPLLQPSSKTLKERLKEISDNLYLLPNGILRQYSSAAIEDWYYKFRKHGTNALNDPPRSDMNTHRTLTPVICQSIKEFLKEAPQLKGSNLISRLDDLGLRQNDEPSEATLYRYIREVRPLYVPNEKEATLKSAFWDRSSVSEWILKIVLGSSSPQDLAEECDGTVPFDKLVDYAISGYFLQRRTALCVLSDARGIKWNLIKDICGVSDDILYRCRKYVENGRTDELFNRKRRKNSESELSKKKRFDTILEIVHSLPSTYNVNRTTWTLPTIRQALIDTADIRVSTSTISRIIRQSGLSWRRARTKLTSTDPEYKEKVKKITAILQGLGPRDRFFSVDEFGPFAIKARGGMTLMLKGETKTILQRQKSRGSLILIGALELCTNQMTHFYSQKKNTAEMIKLLDILLYEYSDQARIYFSWDAASWHASKRLYKKVEEVNSREYRKMNPGPIVKLAPLPTGAQFLNVIESVFSGMARAILHNSDYGSVMKAVVAIDRHYEERNKHFLENQKRAGKKIWGKERVPAVFKETNYCKDPKYR